MMKERKQVNKKRLASPYRRLAGFVLDVVFGFMIGLVAGPIFQDQSFVGTIAAILFVHLYFWRDGATPGKMVVGTEVRHVHTGKTLGLGSMLVREAIGKLLSLLFLGIGCIGVLFDDYHQGWHDKLIQSVVVRREVQDNVLPGRPGENHSEMSCGEEVSYVYGKMAVEAVGLLTSGEADEPRQAWKQAAKSLIESRSGQKQKSPMSAFLGLCEASLVRGFQEGNYTRSVENNRYAIEAVDILTKNPDLGMEDLWSEVMERVDKDVAHDGQMEVVLGLFGEDLLVV